MFLSRFARRASIAAALGVTVVAGTLTARLRTDADVRWDCEGTSMTATEIAARRGVPVEKLDLLRDKRSLDPSDVCALPEKKLNRALYRSETPKPDRPGQAMAWRNMRKMDETGAIPMDGIARAAAHAAAMPEPAASDLASPEQITGTSWTSLGPGNIGGRIRSIVFDPFNVDTVWAGSVGGGLSKSVDGGNTWTPVAKFLPNMAVSSLVMPPDATQGMILAGTGEGFYNGDALRGAGILRSTDGGVTWTQLPSTKNADFQYVNRLAYAQGSGIIYAATRTGVFRTANFGDTWTKALSGEILDIRCSPSPTAGGHAIAGGRNGKAWRTTNYGVTWTAVSGLPAVGGFGGRVELSYAPSDGSIVYASIDRNGGELYRSTDGGATFTRRNTGKSYLGDQGWYDNAIWVSPTNPAHVIVGGVDLWRSTDSGATLAQISQWWSAPDKSAHADHHVIVAHPHFDGTTNKQVFFGNDGGIYRTNDYSTVAKTSGWQELNNNLNVTQFYSMAINKTTGEIIGGAQDNGTLFYKPATGAQQWKETFGGDGGYSAADQTNPNYFYGSYVFLAIHRSSDRGASAEYIYRGITDVDTGCANFIAPFVLDPNNANRMFAGGCSLWRTNNVKAATPTWTRIKRTNADVPISAIAVARGNSNIVWIGHNNGDVFKSTNALAAVPTWTKVTTGLPARYVNRLTISPTNANTVYASFGGFSAQNVWKTTNAGASWAARSGSGASALPPVPIYSLVVHPNSPSTLYVGSEIGVHYSTNDGLTWHNNRSGPAAVAVDELVFSGTTLYAATHGRGIFRSATQ